MPKDADQSSSSRQQSEGPSNPGDDDVSLVTPGPISSSTSYSMGPRNPTLSSSPSYSIELPRAPKKSRTSWLRYWASITPLICGGLGPTLTLMAISGCADRWRTENLPNGTVITEKDPKWVVAITAVAIVVGLFANIFLLMRMLGRGNPKHMQYMSIALWTLESIMNFATVGVYVQIVGDDGDWAYAQGFWMTVCSAGMSSICAFLMALNSFILPPFGKRGEMGLSGPQRVFVVQIMLFIFWLAVGAAVFYGVEESFTFSKSVYFVDITVTTVGFGDVVPNTNLGRALVMPYAIIGIISLGLVITSIRTVVVERGHIRKKLVSVLLKKQQKHLDHLKRRFRRRHAALLGVSMMVMGPHSQTIHDSSVERNLRMIEREELRKHGLREAEKWKEYTALLLAVLVFAIFWLVGAVIFSQLEGWTYFDGLYFCMIFFLTIGYGDFVVTTNAGFAVYIVYSLFTIPIMTILISLMSDTFLSKFQKGAERFGVKGGEDQRYLEGQIACQEKGPRWKYARKLFRRRTKKPQTEKDVERNADVPNLDDEILREEILDEVTSIQESVNENVDLTLGIDKTKSKMPEEETSNHEEVENSHVHRRRRRDDVENDDDESICEEDVDRAIQENRRRD